MLARAVTATVGATAKLPRASVPRGIALAASAGIACAAVTARHAAPTTTTSPNLRLGGSRAFAAASTMASVKAASFRGAPAVVMDNGSVTLTVLPGGGHIASIVPSGSSPSAAAVNPLWEPPWPLVTPALRHVPNEDEFGDASALESILLKTICGHNLCADVFGDHSPGEVEHSDLAFHGEAGFASWVVRHATVRDGAIKVVMRAELPATQLRFERTFVMRPGSHVVKVTEDVTNMLGVQRPFGRAQHVTLGDAFLRNGACKFAANADFGHTWPDDLRPERLPQFWQADTTFEYPSIPRNDGGEADDWRRYPRAQRNSDLCTLRIRPGDKYGWMVADQRHSREVGTAIVYAWERKEFPWLMTWEENRAREHKPWSGRTLTRGLEFSSYAFARGRRWNVEKGALLDTPAFQWLDAKETRSTTFYIGVFSGDGDASDAATVLREVDGALVSDDGSIAVPLE